MGAEHHDRVYELFVAACDLPASQRAPFLERECADDPSLRAQVERLLDQAWASSAPAAPTAHKPTPGQRAPDGAPHSPSDAPGAPHQQPRPVRFDLSDAAPTQIGPYRILSTLGEGGFGVVYLAERREPMVQRVAIKVLKPGMDSKTVLARFEQERQALAVMDHPNVARILDAGTTERGTPYFVMEHVKGEPITVFCDLHRMTIRRRLELFIPVCEAVQHAHMKGIIHRDLKPSNVLVAAPDAASADSPSGDGARGTALVKVIDFGIAKAVSRALTDKTIFTDTGQFIGTPEYMSPEQAEMGALDIDTRADVYSLGVILYELLSGLLPFDPRDLRSRGYAEIQRMIREVDPPSPSRRLSTVAARRGTGPPDRAPAEIAAGRRSEVGAIARELRRELEWIPLKAMRKDRQLRYRTPSDLADDVRNYLAGRALNAGPESGLYRLKKLVRRRRGPVIAGALVGLALIAGAAGTGVGLVRARDAAQDALAAKERAEIAEADARRRADQLEQVAEFQASQLSGIDAQMMGSRLRSDLLADAGAAPGDEGPRRAALLSEGLGGVNLTNIALKTLDATIFDRALKAVDEQFADQPLVRARLLQTLAETLRGLGLLERAHGPQARALEIRRQALGPDHPDTLASVGAMGVLLKDQGKHAEAEPYLRDALERLRRPGHGVAERVMAMGNLALLLVEQGKPGDAESLLSETLELGRRELGAGHPQTAGAITNMGLVLRDLGRLSEAEPYFAEALEIRRKTLGGDHADTLLALNNMGFLLQSQRRLAEAEPYLREALEKQRRALGDDHPHTLIAISNLGFVLRAQSRFDEAEPLHREAIERARRVWGEDHPDTIVTINNLGVMLQTQGRLPEAEPFVREALEKRRRVLGNDHPHTLASAHGMGGLLRAQGRPAEAEAFARQAVEGMTRTLGAGRWETANAQMGLGAVLKDLGRFAEAEERLLAAEQTLGVAEGVPPTLRKKCPELLVALYEAWDQAEPGKGYEAKAAQWREQNR